MLVWANGGTGEPTATRRRVTFDLRDLGDAVTPETGEAGGQPQISVNGAAWTNTGISTLTHIGNGRYYATLTQATVGTAGDRIETRYKSANTVDTPGDTIFVVAFNPNDAAALGLSRVDAAVTSRSSHSAADVWAAATRTLTAFSFSVNLTSGAVQAIWDALTSALTTAGSIGKRLADFITGDAFARLGAPAGASIAADIATRSTLTAGQVDTQLSNTHGADSWQDLGGAGQGAYSRTIHLEDDLGADVVGRPVTVRNVAEDVLFGYLLTDIDGEATFQLDAATYHVLIQNSGLYVPLAAQTLVVSGAGSTTYVLTRQGLQTPTAPELCVVFGTITRPDGLAAANVAISFQIPNAAGVETVGGAFVEVDRVVSATTDAAGFFSVELIRSAYLVPHVTAQGDSYRVQCPAANLDATVDIPDQDNVDLATLLPPA